jgi:hypothetical protein
MQRRRRPDELEIVQEITQLRRKIDALVES